MLASMAHVNEGNLTVPGAGGWWSGITVARQG